MPSDSDQPGCPSNEVCYFSYVRVASAYMYMLILCVQKVVPTISILLRWVVFSQVNVTSNLYIYFH